jgi:hypothetical protein
MTGGRQARHVRVSRRRKGVLVLVAGLVLGALLAGWSVNQILSRTVDPDPPATGDGSPSAGAPDGGTDSSGTNVDGAGDDPSGADGSPVGQCAADVADIEAAVDAARPGVDHWSAHVQARTDMLEGRISTKEMNATYERTKLLGPADQERFSAAVSDIEHPIPCQEVQSRAAGSTGEQEQDCLARSRTAEAALTAAKSTLEEWQSHLHHMEQYADGGMRAGRALQLWVQAWRKAPEGISAFEDAVEALAAAPPCSGE